MKTINDKLLKGSNLYNLVNNINNRFPKLKIMGSSEQETTTGKNYLDLTKHTNTLESNTTILSPNSCQCDAKGNWQGHIVCPIENLKFNTDYTFSAKTDSKAIRSIISLKGYKNGTATNLISNIYYDYFKNGRTFNTGEYDKYELSLYFTGNNATAGTFTLEELQIEEGTSKTCFEPYTGCLPAPSPNFPMPIINKQIGNIELCGIGSYQDYIYGRPNNWYLYKIIQKAQIPTSNWFYDADSTHRHMLFNKPANSINYNKWSANTISEIGILQSGSVVAYSVVFNPNEYTNSEIKEKCVGTNYYYVLNEVVDTKITDKSTIKILNNLYLEKITEEQEDIIIN